VLKILSAHLPCSYWTNFVTFMSCRC